MPCHVLTPLEPTIVVVALLIAVVICFCTVWMNPTRGR